MTFIQHPTFTWPQGQTCAVSLTYDDGLVSHYEAVAPSLEAQGLRGTFYATIKADPRHHPEKWRDMAAKGHELGNHSLFHPCKRTPEFASWLPAPYDLKQYTAQRLQEELEIANLVLHLIDGQHERSYGNNCHHTSFGDDVVEESMDAILAELFVAARGGWTNQIADPKAGLNLMQVGTFSADGRPFEALKAEIEQAMAVGGWIVYTMHGVGPEAHRLHIVEEEHQQLIAWLGQNKDSIWTAPLRDVAKYVRAY